MIEISRYILATMVAQTHLWPLGAAWTGNIAVFAFYTLSGYLMTRVLNERYGFSARGTVAFLLNRVLRLWPAYLAILGLTLIALSFLPLSSFFISDPYANYAGRHRDQSGNSGSSDVRL
jgi:peptidoglycan/LPS O-acetylase OafA/YrhL